MIYHFRLEAEVKWTEAKNNYAKDPSFKNYERLRIRTAILEGIQRNYRRPIHG